MQDSKAAGFSSRSLRKLRKKKDKKKKPHMDFEFMIYNSVE